MSVRINDRVINPDIVSKVIAFLCIYTLLIGVGGVVLSAFDIPIFDSFFSALLQPYPTQASEPASQATEARYELLPDVGKWVLSILMLIGRLEIFTVLLIFTPAFWRK